MLIPGIVRKVGLTHPNVRVKRWAGDVRPRRMLQLSNAPRDKVNCHKNSVDNLLSAVLERAFFVKTRDGYARPPRPLPNVFGRRLRKQHQELVSRACISVPLSRQAFVDQVESCKRRVYQDAAATLMSRDLQRTDSHVSAFIKYEKEIHEWKTPVPRLISPRQYPYLLEDGRHYKVIEKHLMQSIDSMFGAPTVMKGRNVKEVASCIVEAWNSMNDPIAIAVDASRFDQHVSTEALKWQHSVQAAYFTGNDRKYYKMMQNWKLRNVASGKTHDGKVQYTIDGTRTSGDADTGGGNCLLMCAMMHSFFQSLSIHQTSIRLINNGDDCVIITERKYFSTINKHLEPFFLDLGFNMVTEGVADYIEGIEFCQMRPIETVNGWVMVRNPKRALIKDCLSTRAIDKPSVYAKWVDAVCDAGKSLTKGVPIFPQFYDSLAANKPKLKASHSRRTQQRRKRITLEDTGLTRWGWDKSMSRHLVTARARESFFLAFGVSPHHQQLLEHWFSCHPSKFGSPAPEVVVPGHPFISLFD